MKHEKQEDVFVVPFGMRIEDPHGQVIDKIPLEDHAADYLFTASGFSISDEELEYFKNKNEDNSEKPVYTYFSKFDYKEDSDNEQ